MNTILITFSPTGGTLHVARILTQAITGEADKVISLTDADFEEVALSETDLAIIAVPSFSGRVPALAVERLRKIEGNGAKAVLLTVYGNRAYDDTMIELGDVAKEQGFRIIAGVSAITRHSIVTTIAANRPDREDYKILADFGKKIKAKIDAQDYSEISLPGNRPYRKGGPGLTPKTNRKCNDCGLCVKECPAGAINRENPRKIDSKVCINCMRCISLCPNKAKYVPKLMIGLVGRMLKKPCASRKEPELFLN